MDDFIETPRFPTAISYGSAGGPGFKTFVFNGHSAIETRRLDWNQVKARYTINEAIKDMADFDTVRAYFYNCRGKAVGFRFKDWADFQATDEVLGTGDGVNRVFYLKKLYGAGSVFEYSRRIFKPVSGTVVPKVDGVSVAATIDTTLGTVTYSVPNTPADGTVITATFEFDVPVRFDTDDMATSYEGFELQTWNSIPLVEVPFTDA